MAAKDEQHIDPTSTTSCITGTAVHERLRNGVLKALLIHLKEIAVSSDLTNVGVCDLLVIVLPSITRLFAGKFHSAVKCLISQGYKKMGC